MAKECLNCYVELEDDDDDICQPCQTDMARGESYLRERERNIEETFLGV
jgi:hypothetical protein